MVGDDVCKKRENDQPERLWRAMQQTEADVEVSASNGARRQAERVQRRNRCVIC